MIAGASYLRDIQAKMGPAWSTLVTTQIDLYMKLRHMMREKLAQATENSANQIRDALSSMPARLSHTGARLVGPDQLGRGVQESLRVTTKDENGKEWVMGILPITVSLQGSYKIGGFISFVERGHILPLEEHVRQVDLPRDDLRALSRVSTQTLRTPLDLIGAFLQGSLQISMAPQMPIQTVAGQMPTEAKGLTAGSVGTRPLMPPTPSAPTLTMPGVPAQQSVIGANMKDDELISLMKSKQISSKLDRWWRNMQYAGKWQSLRKKVLDTVVRPYYNQAIEYDKSTGNSGVGFWVAITSAAISQGLIKAHCAKKVGDFSLSGQVTCTHASRCQLVSKDGGRCTFITLSPK